LVHSNWIADSALKILFYNHTSQVSGAERVLLLILARLSRERFEPILVCPADGELQKHAKAVGVVCESVEQLQARFTWRVNRLLGYLASFVSVIVKVRQRIIKHQPELIHANSLRAGLVISAATIGLGIPIIWHVHDLLPKHPLSTIIRVFVLLFPPFRIVAVSQVAGDRFRGDMLRLFSRRVTVAVIHNSVDVERLAEVNKEKAIRKELRLRNTDPLIGIVGNLSTGKGQLELIAAYAEVLKRIPDAALLIVGSSIFNREEGYPEQLKLQAKTLRVGERVRFLGQRNDVPAILRSLDLLVLNSKSEAFPLVALEGLACEVPVLSTAVGGVPELITHGQTGWLIPAGDQHKLVEAIVSLLEHPELRRDLGVNGRKHVEKDFTVDKFMTRFEALYSETNARRLAAKQAAMEFAPTTAFSLSRIESNRSTTN
jgi:L-malate glycosyltransferase